MGTRVHRLDDRIESFTLSYWDTDTREGGDSASARDDLRNRGLYDPVRRFLLDVIQRSTLTPEEWARLCNVHVRTPEEVRDDARDFWDWLFDEEPLPGTQSGVADPVRPPQA